MLNPPADLYETGDIVVLDWNENHKGVYRVTESGYEVVDGNLGSKMLEDGRARLLRTASTAEVTLLRLMGKV